MSYNQELHEFNLIVEELNYQGFCYLVYADDEISPTCMNNVVQALINTNQVEVSISDEEDGRHVLYATIK